MAKKSTNKGTDVLEETEVLAAVKEVENGKIELLQVIEPMYKIIKFITSKTNGQNDDKFLEAIYEFTNDLVSQPEPQLEDAIEAFFEIGTLLSDLTKTNIDDKLLDVARRLYIAFFKKSPTAQLVKQWKKRVQAKRELRKAGKPDSL